MNACVAAVLVAGALGWSAARDSRIAAAEAATRPVRVALVQTGEDKRAMAARARAAPAQIAEELVKLSSAALDRDPAIEVVVWPETALIQPPDRPVSRAAPRFAAERGVEVWTGATRSERDAAGRERPYNAAYRIDRAGRDRAALRQDHARAVRRIRAGTRALRLAALVARSGGDGCGLRTRHAGEPLRSLRVPDLLRGDPRRHRCERQCGPVRS